jgi:hypothetical protein
MKMVTQKIRKFHVGGSSYELEYDLETLVANLLRDKALYESQGWSKLALDRDQERYSDDYYYYLIGERLETIEEATAREFEEARTAKNRADYERKEFERLSKKFASEG